MSDDERMMTLFELPQPIDEGPINSGQEPLYPQTEALLPDVDEWWDDDGHANNEFIAWAVWCHNHWDDITRGLQLLDQERQREAIERWTARARS